MNASEIGKAGVRCKVSNAGRVCKVRGDGKMGDRKVR